MKKCAKVLLTMAVLLITSGTAWAAAPIRIGVFTERGNFYAFWGAELFVKDINGKGGLLGRPVELIRSEGIWSLGDLPSDVRRMIENGPLNKPVSIMRMTDGKLQFVEFWALQ